MGSGGIDCAIRDYDASPDPVSARQNRYCYGPYTISDVCLSRDGHEVGGDKTH